MTVHPFSHKRLPSCPFRVVNDLKVGQSLTWYKSLKDGGRPTDPMFSVERLANGWLLSDKGGQLIGCFASLDEARDAGFLHFETGGCP